VVAPDGRALYVALYANGDGPGAVAAFRVGRSGTLESRGPPVLTGGNVPKPSDLLATDAGSWWRTSIKVSQKEA
jgi:hypothetical protein